MISPVIYSGPDNKNMTVSSSSEIVAQRGIGKPSVMLLTEAPSPGGRIAPSAIPLTVISGARLIANDFVN